MIDTQRVKVQLPNEVSSQYKQLQFFCTQLKHNKKKKKKLKLAYVIEPNLVVLVKRLHTAKTIVPTLDVVEML